MILNVFKSCLLCVANKEHPVLALFHTFIVSMLALSFINIMQVPFLFQMFCHLFIKYCLDFGFGEFSP